MVVNNAKSVIKQVLASGDTEGLLPVTDVGGVTRYVADFSAFPAVVEDSFTLTAADAGISVGSGSTAPAETDYQLVTPITSGLTGTVTATKNVDGSGNTSITFAVTLTNTSGSNITVSEIGYKQEIAASDTLNGTTATDRVFLLDRSTFNTITIAPSGQAAIDYTLKSVVTNNGGAEGTKTITQNGTYNAIDDSLDGYSTVTVNVSGGSTLGTKTITQNGIYNASSDNYDGYSQVTVNVSGGGSGRIGLSDVVCNTALPTGLHKNYFADSSRNQIASTLTYGTSRITTIPADTGSIYLVVSTMNDYSYMSEITDISNGTFEEIGQFARNGYSNKIYLFTKADSTQSSTISYLTGSYIQYIPVNSWNNMGNWIEYENLSGNSSLVIPNSVSDYYILGVISSGVSSSTGAGTSCISSIIGGEALRIFKGAYNGSLSELYLIKNNKVSDISISFAYNTTCWGYIGDGTDYVLEHNYLATTGIIAPYNCSLVSSTASVDKTSYEIQFSSASGHEGFAIEIGQLPLGDLAVFEFDVTTDAVANNDYAFGFKVTDTIVNPATSSTYNHYNNFGFSRLVQTDKHYKFAFVHDPTKTYYLSFGMGAVSSSMLMSIDLKVYTMSLV